MQNTSSTGSTRVSYNQSLAGAFVQMAKFTGEAAVQTTPRRRADVLLQERASVIMQSDNRAQALLEVSAQIAAQKGKTPATQKLPLPKRSYGYAGVGAR